MSKTNLNKISQNPPSDFNKKMKRFKYIVLTIFAIIIILTNTLLLFSEWRWYTFSSKDGKYKFDEFEPQMNTLNRVDEL